MRKSTNLALAVFFLFFSSQAPAYETSTHEMLVRNAVTRSVLMDTNDTLLADLGFAPWSYEAYTAPNNVPVSAAAMIAIGAVQEDKDYLKRPFNHFFDPQFNRPSGRGLDVFLIFHGLPSPDWAIEDRGDVVDQNDGKCPSKVDCAQIYSFNKGQKALLAALTESTVNARQSAASLTLRILGHVTHHIQDMAQPQHTRNDQHAHPLFGANPTWSYYELKTEVENTNIENLLKNRAASNTEYPIPKFSTARQFWHSAASSQPQYIGMAEFTAQNFTSSGTQYTGVIASNNIGGAAGFALPDGSGVRLVRYAVPVAYSVDGKIIPAGERDFLVGSVFDGFTNARTDSILAATSLTRIFTRIGAVTFNKFTEDSQIYDARYGILMPRAVAFSTGLINHFFRGRLNFTQLATANQWRITNTSKDANSMNGKFSVYAEDVNGVRRLVAGTERQGFVGVNSSFTLEFVPPAGTVNLVAVFAGQIGTEGDSTLASGFYAVAGKVSRYTPAAAPQISATRNPAIMTAGQPFTVSYSVKDADSASYSCTGGMSTGGTLNVGGSSFSGVASAAWTATPSTCTYSATGPGGTSTFREDNVRTVNAAPPAIACGQQIAASGSSSGLDVLQELGGTPGPISVKFEAYSIPDGVVISANNAAKTVLATSNGLVNGTHSYSFVHDPIARGTTRVQVKVTGNSNSGTAWTLGVSCPNQPAPGTPAAHVKFVLIGGACGGNWTLTVDGKQVSIPGQIDLAPNESHSYLLNVTSWPSSCVLPTPYYDDAAGRHRMWTSQTQPLPVQ